MKYLLSCGANYLSQTSPDETACSGTYIIGDFVEVLQSYYELASDDEDELEFMYEVRKAMEEDRPQNVRLRKGLEDVEILWLGWSSSAVVVNDEHILLLGHNPSDPSAKFPRSISANAVNQRLAEHPYNGKPPFRSAFGDHNGLIGFLDDNGRLCRLDWSKNIASHQICKFGTVSDELNNNRHPQIQHVAMNATGKVVVVWWRGGRHSTSHVLEFDHLGSSRAVEQWMQGVPEDLRVEHLDSRDTPNFHTLMAWIDDPNVPAHQPSRVFEIPGRAKELVANSVAFAVLTEDGEVFTWGDPRHPTSMGRTVDSENPGEMPKQILTLAGLEVKKIAACGWQMGVVTKAGDIYSWGTLPGKGTDVSGRVVDSDQPVTHWDLSFNAEPEITADGKEDSPFAADVTDIAVGRDHIICVEDTGLVWGIGSNSHGQLGLGDSNLGEFVPDWITIDGLSDDQWDKGRKVVSVYASELNSWAIACDRTDARKTASELTAERSLRALRRHNHQRRVSLHIRKPDDHREINLDILNHIWKKMTDRAKESRSR